MQIEKSKRGQLVMDVKSDAASTTRDDTRTWREIDWVAAERKVRQLQARIVKATEKGK